MSDYLTPVRGGMILAFATLLFGIAMGIGFGVAEDVFIRFAKNGIALHPTLHGAGSVDKIWRYAQRAHFHATGIGAFTIGLIILVAFTNLRDSLKSATAILIGLAGLYPLSWLSMFLLSPSMGRGPAHGALATELLAYAGTGALLVGLAILGGNLVFGWGGPAKATASAAE